MPIDFMSIMMISATESRHWVPFAPIGLALPGIILEISPIFCEKNARYLENFVVFTLRGTRYDLSKNDLSIFCRLRPGLSIVLHYCCCDTRFLVS